MFDSFEKGEEIFRFVSHVLSYAYNVLGIEFNGQMQSLLGTGVFNSDGKVFVSDLMVIWINICIVAVDHR